MLKKPLLSLQSGTFLTTDYSVRRVLLLFPTDPLHVRGSDAN